MAAGANNAFLLLLMLVGAIMVFNTILAVMHEADLAKQGLGVVNQWIPSREEAHVHLRQKKEKLPNDAPPEEEEEEEEEEDNVDGEETEIAGEKEDADDSSSSKRGDQSKADHKIAGLHCDAYGGPSEEDAAEMVYWEDIPTDSTYVSPLKSTGPDVKYLTFEPDQGGWNNIRMSMETAVTLAHAMGRTLVMPPVQGMYLLEKGKHHSGKEQKRHFTFTDFFHFDSVATEHAGLDVISMQEFLEREVMKGRMKNKETGETTFPPFNNRTNWDGVPSRETRQLNEWFRSFATNPIWPFDQCMVGIPAKPGPEGPALLQDIIRKVPSVNAEERIAKYRARPVAVDAPPLERLDQSLVNRHKLCVYDEEFQNKDVIHMMGDNDSGARLLVHFYAYLFFEDYEADLWTKRFVRDHLRYVDEIQCAAARVVKEMRIKAREHGNEEGIFDTIHIRRGDFQYKETRVEGDVIYNNIKDVIPDGTTLYIATDERDKSFFKIFHEHYNVYFLDDFLEALGHVNSNFFGMVDQRISSRGRTFVGCYYSTFTGYINRMRGYHSQRDKSEGWEDGIINSFYYMPLEEKYAVREFQPLGPPLWAREFPVAWRKLDQDVDSKVTSSIN